MNSPRSFRTTELVKEFCRQGHQVTLITHYKPEHHDALIAEFGFQIRDLGPLRFSKFLWQGTIASKLSYMVRRSLEWFLEYPDIEYVSKVKKALAKEKGYDLMISIAYPHPVHWGTARAYKKYGSPAKVWVADCGDPYMKSNMTKVGKMFYFKYFEKAFCQCCDYITVPFAGAKEGYYEEFQHKIRVIPQGFKFQDTERLLKPYQPNTIPTFLYAGGFSPDFRDPRPLLHFLNAQDLDFRFHIYTNLTHLIDEEVAKSKGRMIVHSYIPRTELIGVLSQMDFLVNIENKIPKMLPSKLIDYHLSKRPVLSISSDLDTEKVKQFLKGDYSGKLSNDQLPKYNIEKVTRQFLSLLA